MNKKYLEDAVKSVLKERPELPLDMTYFLTVDACGSTACALGDYIIDHPGRGMGFVLSKKGSFRVADAKDRRGDNCWAVVARHFGISTDAAQAMFGPHVESDRKHVARRIRRFVKTGKVPVGK